LSSEPGHFILAVLQGLAAQVAELVDLVEKDTGAALKTLRVDGGLTQSRVLMQSVADLTQRRIEIYPSQHATPLGAAALARVAAKPGGLLKDSIINWSPTHVIEPQWGIERSQEFRSAWAAVADLAL
jgi:glycerol kinase